MLCKVQYSGYFSILQLIGEEPQDGQFGAIKAYETADRAQSALRFTIRSIMYSQKNVANYRDADPNARRLLQVADYICTIARITDAYDAGKPTKTHERFFGKRRSFEQSSEKQLKRKGSLRADENLYAAAPMGLLRP